MLVLVALTQLAAATPVAVNARRLHPGEPIEERDLYQVEFPDDLAPHTSFSTAEDLVGRVPRRPIWPHTIVREEHLAPKNAGSGSDALLRAGETLVHVEIPYPRQTPAPGDWVDVSVYTPRGPCIAAESVRVAAAELEDGTKTTRRGVGPFVAAHLAVPIEQAPQIVAAAGRSILLVRNSSDTSPTDLPRCSSLIHQPAIVRPQRAQVTRRHPAEPFQVIPLTTGEKAYLGWFELAPMAVIGPRELQTELVGVVIEGHGTLVFEGEAFELRPGDAIYLPAWSTYTFRNGARPFRMVEAFPDHGVSDAYGNWPTAGQN